MHSKFRNGWTTIHHACAKGHEHSIELLLEDGGDDELFCMKNDMGRPPWLSPEKGVHFSYKLKSIPRNGRAKIVNILTEYKGRKKRGRLLEGYITPSSSNTKQ